MTPYDYSFLNDNMTARFIKTTLNQKIKNKLYDIEKQFIPLTQEFVQMTKIKDSLNNTLKELREAYKHSRDPDLLKEISELHVKVHEIETKLNGEICTTMLAKYHPCPSSGCKGYVDHNTWKCGLCMTCCCERCLCLKHEEHECKQEDILSYELIKNETKPCPKCTAPCFKVDGCDQVFAVCCKIAFSWNTGKIDKSGYIHAPDYYKWMTQTGKEIPINNPAMLPSVSELLIQRCDPKFSDIILGTHAIVDRLFREEIPFYIEKTTFSEMSNRDLRIHFMMTPQTPQSEITLKIQLLKRYKISQGRIRILAILQNYISDAINTLRLCTKDDTCDLQQASKILSDLRDSTNRQISKLTIHWDTVPILHITNDWYITYE
jgi:hypothetical protein